MPTINNAEREMWVNNDEGLYRWWKREGGSLRDFIKNNREEIDALIERATDGSWTSRGNWRKKSKPKSKSMFGIKLPEVKW